MAVEVIPQHRQIQGLSALLILQQPPFSSGILTRILYVSL